MGTNYVDFLFEAHRTLRTGGTLIVAEVESRIAGSLQEFIQTLRNVGFGLTRSDTSQPFFSLFYLTKVDATAATGATHSINKKKNIAALQLKACKYKKR